MRWEWHGFKLKIIVLALAAGLLVLLGGHWAYKSYGYNQPLVQALGEDSAVESFEIEDKPPVLLVIVQVNRTENLMETYQRLDRRVKQSVSNRPYELVIKDNRNARLAQAYYRSQFAVHEAVMRGNFREMLAVVEENAREAGAEARVFIDSDNVYVQMDAVDHHLAVVIHRVRAADDVSVRTGGGLYVQRG